MTARDALFGGLIALAAAAACAEAPPRAPAPPMRPAIAAAHGATAAVAPSAVAAAPSAFAAGAATPADPLEAAARQVARAAEAAHVGALSAAIVARAGFDEEVGYAVIDVETGALLDGRAADTGFAPASVAKIPTALYALEALGPEGRFETRVLAAGPISDGRLDGDLILSGGGDPELDAADLARLARAARERVGAVTGGFRVDAGVAARAIDDSVPPEAAYNPSVARLNLNFNRVRLAWERAGNDLSHSVEAHAEGWSPAVSSVAVAFAPDDCRCPAFDHAVGEEGEVWRVRRAALRGEGSVWLPVRRPAEYAAEVFRLAAAEAGLALPEATMTEAAAGLVVARRESRPAIEIVADMLEFSTNLTAEALGLGASAALGLPAGDLAASARAMSGWSAGFAGVDLGAFDLRNHSGLTPDSRVTPRAMATLLRAAAVAGDAAADLAPLLEERPLDDRDARAAKGATVRAKTGTLDFVRGLAGYAVTPSGRRLAFAFFANDLDRRAATRGQGNRPAGAIPFRNRASRLERDLLRLWIARFD